MRFTVYGLVLETEWRMTWPVIPTERTEDLTFVTQSFAPPGVPPILDLGAVPLEGWEVHEAPVTFHQAGDHAVIRFRGVADHYVWPDRIICHLQDDMLAHLVEIQLLGMVLALWLECRGVPTLHASVVAIEGQAVAFLGAPGGGKTTAATALVAAGHELLVDDLVASDIVDGRVRVQPGYPCLRLWPDQIGHFRGDHTGYRQVHPTYDKRLVDVGNGFGRFRSESAPLARIYLPRRSDPGTALSIEPMGLSTALLVLVTNSFLPEVVHGLGLAATRLASLAARVELTPMRRLRYASGFERLPDLVAAIERDVQADPS